MVPNQPRERFAPFRGRSGRRRKASLTGFVTKYLGFQPSGLIQHWTDIYYHVEQHEGKLAADRKAKAWYDSSLRLAAGLEITPLPFCKSDKEGYPKVLSPFKAFLTGNSPDVKRAVLTILQLYKLSDSKGEPSFRGITTPYAGKDHPEWLDDYVIQLEKMFPPSQLDNRIAELKPGYHISGKNGPNGPSLGTVHADRVAISGTNIEAACKSLAALTGFSSLSMVLSSAGAMSDTIHHNKGRTPYHSRLRTKFEPGGKARPFAIVDFFSQSALKALHDYFMKWLESQPNDGTASHDVAAQAVKRWSSDPSKKLWSYDLTEATNRWPLFLEWLVVKAAFGPEIADAWRTVISDRDFEIADGPERIRFNCGQPLGALSSWAVFAVSHHAVVRLSCWESWKEEGPRRGSFKPSDWNDQYRIIGDDICIRHPRVAARYRDKLSDIAVDISIAKSVLPEQTSTLFPVGELAKRVFVGGIELTPIPPDAVLLGLNPYGIRYLLEQCQMRGYTASESPYLVQSTLLSQGEFAELTFPFRNALPLMKGLQRYYEVRTALNLDFNDGPLDQRWFQWMNIPEEEIADSVRTFLLSQVVSAEEASQEIVTAITYQTYGLEVSDYELPGLPQGGDWQPGAITVEPTLLREVMDQVQETLNRATMDLYQPGLSNLDLYSFIGRLQVFLDPKLLVFGRKARDQKAGTRTYMAKIVKYLCRTGLAQP